MEIFDVQISTDMDEFAVLQVYADNSTEAEMIAVNMVESGEAGTQSRTVTDCFALT